MRAFEFFSFLPEEILYRKAPPFPFSSKALETPIRCEVSAASQERADLSLKLEHPLKSGSDSKI